MVLSELKCSPRCEAGAQSFVSVSFLKLTPADPRVVEVGSYWSYSSFSLCWAKLPSCFGMLSVFDADASKCKRPGPTGSNGWIRWFLHSNEFRWMPSDFQRRFGIPVAWRVAQNSRINSLKWHRFSWQNPSQWLSSPVPSQSVGYFGCEVYGEKAKKKQSTFGLVCLRLCVFQVRGRD